MKRAFALLLVAAGLAACAPAAANLAQQIAACEQSDLPEQQISACTTVITDAGADARQRAMALVRRGMVRAAYGEHARAVADFGRALRIDSALADAYVERGRVHQQRGVMESALRDYDAALAIDPTLASALQARNEALAGVVAGLQTQIQALNEALARTPHDVSLLNNRCWIRAVAGEELDAALADCNAALLLEPRHAAALDSRGLVQLKRGAFDAALADYEAALAGEPGRGHYLYGRGLARLALGQSAEARADFTAAEANEPGVTTLYESYRATPQLIAAHVPVAAKP
jgi:tetratricopeptide (TPR) repeat protein